MKRKISFALKRWHRRLGVVSAVFVMVLAITGLLLLFAGALGLDQKNWSGPLIANAYNQAPKTAPTGISLGAGDWLVMVDGLVYIGAADPVSMAPPLVMAAKDKRFVLFANTYETVVTLHDGTLVERMAGVDFTGASPTPIPDEVRSRVLRRYSGRGMAASRVLLDIHTGRFFGQIGTWLMAVASVFFMLLSLSGLYMWIKKPNGKANAKNPKTK